MAAGHTSVQAGRRTRHRSRAEAAENPSIAHATTP